MDLKNSLKENLRNDGLVERLREKIQVTDKKIQYQCAAMSKIQRNVELLMPIKQNGARMNQTVNSMDQPQNNRMNFEGSPNKNIQLGK